LKDRINESESGIGAPFALNGELGPPRFRRILKMWMFQNYNSLQLSYV
jgi:hypothetical protein